MSSSPSLLERLVPVIGLAVLFVVVFAFALAAIFTVTTFLRVLRTPDGAVYQSGSKTIWVVVILLTGVIGALLFHFAGRPIAHEVFPVSGGYFACAADGCDFETQDGDMASQHERVSQPGTQERTGTDGIASAARGQARLLASAEPAPTELVKLCPDCAEEIRVAARKCRFCGFAFETSEASA